jgi:hypothetical protein
MERLRYIPPEEEVKFEIETNESKELHTPYYGVTLEAFSKEFPEQRAEMKTVLDEIDKQSIENFAAYKSEAMEGVSFSYTKLSITPEIMSRLSQKSDPAEHLGANNFSDEMAREEEANGEEETAAKRQDYFLFCAFGLPPDGTAFTAGDIAIDRFIRLMPRVARPMKKGEEIPEVNIYVLGAPTGFAGSVTQEWIDQVKENGLETHAKLYAEFIKKHEPEDDSNRHIVLQGVSKGAVVAEKTSKYLPEEVQKNTQRLLDNPAGDHKPGQYIKGAEVLAGMVGETVARVLFDKDMMQPLMKVGGPFLDKLSEKTGIAKDDKEQSKLKLKAALAEALALIKGSPMDTESTRSFIRQGIGDPLSFSPKRLYEIWKKEDEGVGIPMFSKGKTLEVPFKGKHFFIYNRYNRWNKVLEYVEGR